RRALKLLSRTSLRSRVRRIALIDLPSVSLIIVDCPTSASCCSNARASRPGSGYLGSCRTSVAGSLGSHEDVVELQRSTQTLEYAIWVSDYTSIARIRRDRALQTGSVIRAAPPRRLGQPLLAAVGDEAVTRCLTRR